jgi:hypothetical protein
MYENAGREPTSNRLKIHNLSPKKGSFHRVKKQPAG